MKIWRRRRRFKPFDRTTLPPASTSSFQDLIDEGLLVAEAAVRMSLKNRFVVDALREGTAFNQKYATQLAREVLEEIATEAEESAAHTAAAETLASGRKGSSKHQHDYHHADTKNLRRRSDVHSAIAKLLAEYRDDPEYIELIAERARAEAANEIVVATESAVPNELFNNDTEYSAERSSRLKELFGDIKRERKKENQKD